MPDFPEFLVPLLDYLSKHLPPSLFTAFSYGLILLSGIFSFVAALPSWKPWEWDVQKVIPPFIMFLAAYYTLLSLYRTTSFMVRMTFRIIKWGAILTVLGAGIGRYTGTDGGREGGGALDVLRETLEEAAAAGGRAGGKARPHPWDSFEAHQQWHYDERQTQHIEEESTTTDAQRVIQHIASFAGRVVGGSAFDLVAGAKSFLDSVAEASTDGVDNGRAGTDGQGMATTTGKQSKRKMKASTQRQTSSR